VPPLKNYYKILQVDPDADPEVISAAYKRLSIKYHPDTNPSRDANRRMLEINEAYQVLKDPVKRAHYDRELDWGKRGNGNYGAGSRHGDGDDRDFHRRQTHPQANLPKMADVVVALAFPVSYVLVVFILFRFIRPYNIFLMAAVVILAGIIAYHISARVEKYFKGK
jgi:hypothetical protein